MLPLAELDGKLARLLGSLEHAASDTSTQVERAIEDVSRAVPRLTFDLQLMRENVTLLRFTLDSIRKRSAEATNQNETSAVMRRLKVLDTIKTRMEAARDVLREAEAWSTLESEVTGLVQEQAYAKAAERLSEANKSMVVFQNTPEYETRRSLMVSLQNSLEAGLSASLVSAINARDAQACKTYYAIFEQIQRESEFRSYYFGSRRANLLEDWQVANLTDCAPAATVNKDVVAAAAARDAQSAHPTTFSNYLPTFFNLLEKTINEERTYISTIFPQPLDTLSLFLQTTLDALVPSFPQRISDLSNAHGPRLLLELIKAYRATEEFAIAVDRIFSRMSGTLLPQQPPMASPNSMVEPPSTPAKGGSHSGSSSTPTPGSALKHTHQQQRLRRSSRTLSISRRSSRGGLHTASHHPQTGSSSGAGGRSPSASIALDSAESREPIRAWETTLYEPFLDWQAEYTDLEFRLLSSELQKVTAGQDAMAHLLSSSTVGDDDGDNGASSSAVNRKGGAKVLLEQTTTVFGLAEDALGRSLAFTRGYGAAGFVEAVDGIFKTFLLKERDTLLQAKDARSHRRRLTNASRVSSTSMNGQHRRLGGGEEHISMEHTTDDWAAVQLALRLLETSRTIWERIASFEDKVCSRLVDVSRLLAEARHDPDGQLLPGTTRGSLSLLWQSTLNSAALASLLDSVDRYTHAHSGSNPSSQPHGPAPVLFTQARAASVELTRASQLFLHDTILGPIMQALASYSLLSAWTQASERRPDQRSALDLHIPTFSLSPSETITRVGEGFLNLPAMFEAYADDNALGFSLETLPNLDPEMLRNLRKEPGGSLHNNHAAAHSLTSHHSLGRHRPSMSVANNEFLPAPPASANDPASVGTPANNNGSSTSPQAATRISPSPSHQGTVLSVEVITSTWLSSLTRTVLLHLTDEILPSIRALSSHGAEQLLSDLSYLSNVAKALDVEVEQVEKWRVALEYTGGDSSSVVRRDDQQEDEASNPFLGIEGNEVVDVVKRMRARPVTMRT